MMFRSLRLALPVITIGVLALVVTGCSKKAPVVPFRANQRPVISLTRAPYNQSTRFSYSYQMDWVGYDPDGRIAYYLYAIDPPSPTAQNPNPDTLWVQTNKTEHTINFTATQLDSTQFPEHRGASDFHVFVVKAIDNGGLQSEPIMRAFFTYTIAPTCSIVSPVPVDGIGAFANVAPSIRISWTGADEDGIFDSKKPVKYKFIMLNESSSAVLFSTALANPDSVRRYYAPRNWAGWDSTTADTTTASFKDLIPGGKYMFCVVSFDEAGAYSPIFNLSTNMLQLRITYAALGGPALVVFNDFFFYAYNSGHFSLLPQYHIPVEIPAGQPVTINWTWDPEKSSPGADIKSFQWALDIDDPSDQSPRNPERTDLKHWSAPDPATMSATVGPFPGGEVHFFYIKAEDSNGLSSLGIVDMTIVQSSLLNPLAIVNDTRLTPDFLTTGGCTMVPTGRWPSQAELDTFLFARGWVPWKCYPPGSVSRPGLFSGYSYDTIGTRSNLSTNIRVPLATIGNYRHIVWITDDLSAAKSGLTGADQFTALRFMTQPQRANSIAAYVHQGGEVWFVGGGCGFATLIAYNKTNNDVGQGKVWSNANNELIPGRMMFDLCHWQSEYRQTKIAPLRMARFLGRMDTTGISSSLNNPYDYDQYKRLPLNLRLKSLSLGDSVPPNRANPNDFYQTQFAVEYLSLENRIVEDIDPSPFVDNEQSTLDTLYYARASNMVDPSFNAFDVIMTRYWGPGTLKPVIFTGFNVWNLTFQDCKGVVDAVLQGLWKLPYSGPAPPARLRPVNGSTRAWSPPAATPPGPARSGSGVVAATRPGRP